MNFTLCVLLVYNDNGSVQTLCTERANHYGSTELKQICP